MLGHSRVELPSILPLEFLLGGVVLLQSLLHDLDLLLGLLDVLLIRLHVQVHETEHGV